MRTPYLIQRMRFKNNPTGETIDGILEMDYMGSAEFEFGALPESLKKMTKTADEIIIEIFKDIKNYKNQKLCLIGLESDIYEYLSYVDDLINERLRLKERTNIKESITGKDFRGRPVKEDSHFTINAWWDIDNQIMFCFGKDNARKIIKAIKALRDKKKKEKVEGWY